jgi:ABC-type polysaccharide/polyol phosphate transport system ATPase subunit
MAAIEFVNVSKYFSRATGRKLLRGHLAGWLTGRRHAPFYALKDVSFQVESGESLAVIGRNGAGKSTLLSLVAGLTRPDEGSIWVDGRVAALLELGSGFHPDLTGAENVRLNAALLGLSRRRTNALFDEIVEFAGAGEVVQEPLRTYSSGMLLRLAFAVAIHMDPEILVVDEVLAVGDQAFQAKCLDKIHELRDRGKTMLCVSQATEMVQAFCDRAIWLDAGRLIMTGDVPVVCEAYSGHHAAAHRTHLP